MLSNIGVPGLILILVIALIIFGPSKLPEIGKAVGSSLKEFKKATKEMTSGGDEEPKKVEEATIVEEPKKIEEKKNDIV